jgi:hypothetical protein
MLKVGNSTAVLRLLTSISGEIDFSSCGDVGSRDGGDGAAWSYDYDSARPPHKRAFEILNQRLAKGEIDRSEYGEKRRTIAQGR